MKEFEFTAFQENNGSYEIRGTVKAETREKAIIKIQNEDFDEDATCEIGDDLEPLSIYKHNGDTLFECLEKIKNLNDINLIHLLVEETLNNMVSPITIDDITEIEK